MSAKKDTKMEDTKMSGYLFRSPQNIHQAIGLIVDLGIYKSRNEFILDTVLQHLRLTAITLSVWIDVKKKAKNPLEYYALFGKALQNRFALEAMDLWVLLSNRVSTALNNQPINVVEEYIHRLETLIGEDEKMDADSVMPDVGEDPPK